MIWIIAMNQFAFAQETADDSVDVPEVWVQCQPISGLINLEKMLPVAYRESTKGLGELGVDGFQGLGGNPEGALRAYGSEGLTMQIPLLQGEANQDVEALLRRIQPHGLVWQEAPLEWSLELVDDQWRGKVSDQYLSLYSADGQETIEMPSILDKLSNTQEGCWLVVSSDATIPKTEIPLNGGLFLPFGDDPFSLFFRPKEVLPSILEGEGATPLSIHTPKAPAVLLSLGFDWTELFLDPAFQERLQMSENDARKLARRLRIQPGGIVAFQNINIRKDPKISVALELHNRFGAPQCAWLIWRGIIRSLRQAGLDPVKLDKGILSFVNNGQVLYVGVVKGRLLLANTKIAIQEMMTNEGVQWGSDEFAAFAAEQPMALHVAVPSMMGMMVGGLDSVQVGARTIDKHAQLTFHVNMMGEGDWTGLLPFLAGQLPEPEDDVLATDEQKIVQTLAAMEHQHFKENGRYLAVGRTGVFDLESMPVPQAILDSAPPENSASMMGWIEQPENGLYWVELFETDESTTFMVHGVFLLQGSLVHYTKDHLGQIAVEPI